MNMQTSAKRRTVRALLPVVGAVIALGFVPTWASPPKREQVPEGLEKVGDFFFRLARTLERGFSREDEDIEIIYDSRRRQPLSVEVVPAPRDVPPRTGIVVPPGYQGSYYGPDATARVYPRREVEVRPGYPPQGDPFVPPRFQPNPQPDLQHRRMERREGSSIEPRDIEPGVNSPTVEDTRPGARRSREDAPFDPPSDLQGKTRSEKSQGDGTKPKTEGKELDFAAPVPGHSGFVYPPGVQHDPKNMLDVRDFAPGQKVKDPRTGEMFLVPPK